MLCRYQTSGFTIKVNTGGTFDDDPIVGPLVDIQHDGLLHLCLRQVRCKVDNVIVVPIFNGSLGCPCGLKAAGNLWTNVSCIASARRFSISSAETGLGMGAAGAGFDRAIDFGAAPSLSLSTGLCFIGIFMASPCR